MAIIEENLGNSNTTDPIVCFSTCCIALLRFLIYTLQKEVPDAVIDAISTMHSALQLLTSRPTEKTWEQKLVNSEKVQWFQAGVFATLVNIVCRLIVSPTWESNLIFKETIEQTIQVQYSILFNLSSN